MNKIAFLGPEGTFTHQAANTWMARAASRFGPLEPCAMETTAQVHDAVALGEAAFGLIPEENSIEGYVTPTVDALLGSAEVLAIDAVALEISFDAFVLPDHGELTTATAHPHGLAQVARYVAAQGWRPAPTTSNAAACRDLTKDQVAFGPRLTGQMYGLETYQKNVEDFPGARTRFLVLARRDKAPELFRATRNDIERAVRRESKLAARLPRFSLTRRRNDPQQADGFSSATIWRTILAITPAITGPGVLARVTAAFGANRVNMSSLVTRPLKVRAEQYVFVTTLDGAPWDPSVRALMDTLLSAGDSRKVMGAYPATPDEDALDGVLPASVPAGSVNGNASAKAQERSLLW